MLSIDILSKFLVMSGGKPLAQNDDQAATSFTAEEKTCLYALTRKYSISCRSYPEQEGERIDFFMDRMERHYKMPRLSLTKHPDFSGESAYRILVAGENGYVLESSSFGAMQTSVTRILMARFKSLGLRCLET